MKDSWVGGDGSVVQSTGFSSGNPVSIFMAMRKLAAVCNLSPRGSSALFWPPPRAPGTQVVYRQTCRQTHTHTITNKIKYMKKADLAVIKILKMNLSLCQIAEGCGWSNL